MEVISTILVAAMLIAIFLLVLTLAGIIIEIREEYRNGD